MHPLSGDQLNIPQFYNVNIKIIKCYVPVLSMLISIAKDKVYIHSSFPIIHSHTQPTSYLANAT